MSLLILNLIVLFFSEHCNQSHATSLPWGLLIWFVAVDVFAGVAPVVMYLILFQRPLLIQKCHNAHLWIPTSVMSLISSLSSCAWQINAPSLCKTASVLFPNTLCTCAGYTNIMNIVMALRGGAPFQCSSSWRLLPRETETCCDSSVIWSQADFTLWHLSLWVKWPL